jgi:Zn-finger nucleic acid-binding protein
MTKCPSCKLPLCRVEYEGQAVFVCPDCRGAMVEAARFRAIERCQDQPRTEAELRAAAEAAKAADRIGPLRCPRCLIHMEKVREQVAGATFHVDLCRRCLVLWFDRGELELAQAVFEKSGRTFTSKEIQDAARQAATAEKALYKYKDATNLGLVAEVVDGLARAMKMDAF